MAFLNIWMCMMNTMIYQPLVMMFNYFDVHLHFLSTENHPPKQQHFY